MTNYTCKKCGSNRVYAKPTGRTIGVYCVDCGEWICQTTYSKMLDMYRSLTNEDLGTNIALREIRKRSGVTMMRCKDCRCLLYSSLFPNPQGQFNLLNAKYCPQCGKELI